MIETFTGYVQRWAHFNATQWTVAILNMNYAQCYSHHHERRRQTTINHYSNNTQLIIDVNKKYLRSDTFFSFLTFHYFFTTFFSILKLLENGIHIL